MSKVAVWFKDGRYAEHRTAADNEATLMREGHTMMIVVYDAAGNISQADLYQGSPDAQIITSFTSKNDKYGGEGSGLHYGRGVPEGVVTLR